MKKLQGIIPPALTPLSLDQSLDTAALERLMQRMISGGINGVFILGTTGEGPALGIDRQTAMIRESARILRHRVPLLAGISASSLDESIRLARIAKAAGVDAVVAATPCYYPLGEAEVLDFFSELAGAVAMPLYLYNMPSMTKTKLSPELIEKLSHLPGVVGCKDSSGDMTSFHEILQRCGGRDDFSILMGPEELLGESVLAGGDGGVCGGANLQPELFTGMYAAALRRDTNAICQMQRDIYRQRELYRLGHYSSSIIKGLKCALAQLGICQSVMCDPFRAFAPAEVEKVQKILKALGLL
ncbi:MAG: dihydrodipicolinate synthase family protein [Victivallaceae bacterium]|nr:dihydrodipicolinate synthase family protein [Victivallaceae bacterium]